MQDISHGDNGTEMVLNGTEKTKLHKKNRLEGDCYLMLGHKGGITEERMDDQIIEGSEK